MNDAIVKTLLNNIITKNDAAKLAESFDAIEKKIFSYRGDWKELLKTLIGADFYHILAEAPDENELLSVFGKFREAIASMDTARIDIAFEPTYEFLSKISELISRESGRKEILDINVSKKLIGGLQISFSGRFADISLEKKIKDLLN